MSGVVTASLSALCYALSYICLRKGQADTDSEDHGLLPVLIVGSIVLGVSLSVKLFRDPAPLVVGPNQKWSILVCVMAGVIGTCFGRMALYGAIARLGATRGVIIDMLSPLVTLAIAVSFLGEKFQMSSIYGMMCIVMGMSLLGVESIWFPSRFLKGLFRSGVSMALLAAVLQGIGHTMRKPSIVSPISPTFAATLDVCSALVLYILLLAISGRLVRYIRIYLRHFNPNFVAAGCLSAAAVLLFFSASSIIPVSKVSMIISVQPVIIALLSRVLMKDLERLTWFTFTSSVLVTLGIVAMSI